MNQHVSATGRETSEMTVAKRARSGAMEDVAPPTDEIFGMKEDLRLMRAVLAEELCLMNGLLREILHQVQAAPPPASAVVTAATTYPRPGPPGLAAEPKYVKIQARSPPPLPALMTAAAMPTPAVPTGWAAPTPWPGVGDLSFWAAPTMAPVRALPDLLHIMIEEPNGIGQIPWCFACNVSGGGYGHVESPEHQQKLRELEFDMWGTITKYAGLNIDPLIVSCRSLA